MGAKKTKTKTKINLASGRPPNFHQQRSTSRKATKALINKHHLLEKRKQQAASRGDKVEEAAINAQIKSLGGIERYQQASLQGQRDDRGGDSSRILMQWLDPCSRSSVRKGVPVRVAGGSGGASGGDDDDGGDSGGHALLRMLEVGALSTRNACSQSGWFDMTRIDLNSQDDGIIQQDFMQRPLPADDSQRFDMVSLSLVLNFVADPQRRGEMLLRTLEFLRDPVSRAVNENDSPFESCCPALFLVLPAPCVTNSRYLDEARLEDMMGSIGYAKAKAKITQRLVYYLWVRQASQDLSQRREFPKRELRSGAKRNNFAIVLKYSGP